MSRARLIQAWAPRALGSLNCLLRLYALPALGTRIGKSLGAGGSAMLGRFVPSSVAVSVMLAITSGPTFSLPPGSGNDLLPDIPVSNTVVKLQSVLNIAPNPVIDITSPRDGSGRLFLVSPNGVIRIFKNGSVLLTPFLNMPAYPPDRGMTSLEFHPNFTYNGKFYVITGEWAPSGGPAHYRPPQNDTPSAFDNVLYEFRVDPTNPDAADVGTKRELLRIHQAHSMHNVNDMAFGGDGYLYIAVGDGGDTRSGTPTHYNTTGQQTTNPYGSILRIDVNAIGPNGRYAIPPDNPFVGTARNAPEIFAWGVRNPWRICADRVTGEIYTGVNGDFTIEQIYHVLRGKNYGWDVKEGSFLWDPESGDATVDPNPDPQFTKPFAEYDHNGTTEAFGSVIGGFVYRGSRVPALYGKYVSNDWLAGRMIAMDIVTGDLELIPIDPSGSQLQPYRDITWGEDELGELYIGRSNGEVLSFASPTGVWDIAPPTAFHLHQNVPNPFNPKTLIRFDVPTGGGRVTLKIFDVRGNAIRTLVDGVLSAGEKTSIWNGRNDREQRVASGVYFYRLTAPQYEKTLRMVLLQ